MSARPPAAPTLELVADGLCFPEGPRGHDGALWFSDMHAHRVCRLEPDGTVTTVLEVDDAPSGLGWLPNGDLLVVAMTSRLLLRWDGSEVSAYADLSGFATWHCNDMVVGRDGTAWVGNFGFDLHAGAPPTPAMLVRVDPDRSVHPAAEDLRFPNGTVLTPDERTLIVAESFAGRLTAFDVDGSRRLQRRRVWAELPEGAVPDGICMDADGAIWVASPTTAEVLRVREGGTVTHRVATGRPAFAAMLLGDHLYVLTAEDSDPAACRANPTASILRMSAPFAHFGRP